MADDVAPMVVAIDAARGVLALRRGAWSCTVPLAHYAAWVDMYRGLRDRHGERFSRFYSQPVAALEAQAGPVKEALR